MIGRAGAVADGLRAGSDRFFLLSALSVFFGCAFLFRPGQPLAGVAYYRTVPPFDGVYPELVILSVAAGRRADDR